MKKDLRIYGAIAVLLVIAAACVVWLTGEWTHKQASLFGGPFQLTSSDGRTVTDRDFRGRYMLIYFGYTYCPDICPTTMADLGIALKQLGSKADDIQPLFITVNPARDTPEVLKQYTAQFSPRLLGLTGTAAQIASVEKAYRVYTEIHRTGSAPDDYTVDHSSVFYLMGPNGDFDAVIRADQSGEAMAGDISHHLKQDKP